jgi:hypothetical protein
MIVISLRIALFIHLRSFLEAMCRHAKGRKFSNIMGRTSTAGKIRTPAFVRRSMRELPRILNFGLLEPLSMSDRPDEVFGGVS